MADQISSETIPYAPQEARIQCPKCKAQNLPNQLRCTICRADLLPGEGVLFRIGVFIFSLLAAGFFGWLAYALATNAETAPPICEGPLQPAFIAVGVFFMGLLALVRQTPRYTRYANRAERHTGVNLTQALDDYNRAIEIAPEKERAPLLQKRARVYEKLGRQEEATRDLIAYTYEAGAYRTGAGMVTLLGADAETYASGRASDERKLLIQSGKAVALGYCRRCRDVVELDPKLRCPNHRWTKPKEARLFIPSDVEAGRAEILATIHRKRFDWLKRLLRFAAAMAILVAGLLIVLKLVAPQESPATKPTQSLPAVLDDAAVSVTDAVFDQEGVSFTYPSNWEMISASQRQELLRTSLKGLEGYDYLGGVFINGASNCPDCAQIIVLISPIPSEGEVLSEARYTDIKAEAQNTMGSRLLEHNFQAVNGIPAVVSKYIGKSQESQQWDIMLLIPDEERMLMVSCSAHRDAYADFEPIFTATMESLAFEFGIPELPTPTPPPLQATQTPVVMPLATVNRSSINVRSGPGTGFGAVAGLARGSEVRVVGRNEAGDWLKIADPEGWVLAELVTLSVPVSDLPVVESFP